MATPDRGRLLQPDVLARIKSLQLKSRLAAEGALTGLHKSPLHGASVEFAEHKVYAPGDEIRHIDWKVFAKSDKYYVKQYEQETNVSAMLLIDASASMRYKSSDALESKWDYACMTAAAMAYLLLRQQDAVGLTLADEDVRNYVPPRSRSTHLMHLCELMVQSPPKPEAGTNLLAGVTHLSEVLTRRGIVFVLSDFLDRDPHFFRVLKQLKGRRQQVHLMQVLDPWEIDFPFHDMTVFRSLETGREILAEPRMMRKTYLREMRRFINELRVGSLEAGMSYRLLRTNEPRENALTSFLTGRSQEDLPELDGV